MDLFNTDIEQNLLPFDGEVIDYGLVLNSKECQLYLNTLLNANFWSHDEIVMFGKKIITDRKIAWIGESDHQYFYSGTPKKAHTWTPELIELKKLIELKTGRTYNSCLLNLYHNGNEGLGWHQDNEKEINQNEGIASLSFGAARKFSFKHLENKQKIDIILEPGRLLLMKGETQKNWLHSLPKSKKIQKPRINLTFRYFHHH